VASRVGAFQPVAKTPPAEARNGVGTRPLQRLSHKRMHRCRAGRRQKSRTGLSPTRMPVVHRIIFQGAGRTLK